MKTEMEQGGCQRIVFGTAAVGHGARGRAGARDSCIQCILAFLCLFSLFPSFILPLLFPFYFLN